ncbi:MAG: hypothetical protein ICV66_10835 [Chitinophagaceae bacterium]|nr:hypothetical protein [Chitinophagaceae bacterium]
MAFLLALMLFSWLVIIHIPDAIAHPNQGSGNEIVSAFDALLFCGVAPVISNIYSNTKIEPALLAD